MPLDFYIGQSSKSNYKPLDQDKHKEEDEIKRARVKSNKKALLVTDFVNFKQSTLLSHIGLLCVFHSIDNSCTNCTSDSVIVGLLKASNCRDACLDKVMLRQVYFN